ncbi:GntR family transcriptional regulator [Streptomyces sp. ID38640]|nr:GntR family transcriptional regulator [Streptomyces sp. ID38640]
MHDALATHIADRLRAQIAAGVYARGTRLPSAKFLATTVCSDSSPVGRALQILAAEGTVHIGPRGSEVAQSARLLPHPAPTAPHHDEKNPRFSRDTIVATCRAAHEQWRRRRPAPAEVLHGRWQDLRSMAGQLLAAAPDPAPDATQDLAALARAAELASAPLPDAPWLQQWHTACLAKEDNRPMPRPGCACRSYGSRSSGRRTRPSWPNYAPMWKHWCAWSTSWRRRTGSCARTRPPIQSSAPFPSADGPPRTPARPATAPAWRPSPLATPGRAPTSARSERTG